MLEFVGLLAILSAAAAVFELPLFYAYHTLCYVPRPGEESFACTECEHR